MSNLPKTRMTVWGCLAASLSLVGLTWALPGLMKALPTSIGLGITVLGYMNARELEELEEDLVNDRVTRGTNRQLHLMGAVQEAPKPFVPPKNFRWDKLMSQRDQNPFIMLLSGQGGGKTTLAGFLLASAPKSTVAIAATSHPRPGDLSAVDISVALDLSEPCDFARATEPVSVPQDFQGNAFKFLDSILLEQQNRKVLVAAGKSPGPNLDVFIDEVPSVYKWLKNSGKDGVSFWDNCVMSWLTETRKYGIRLILGAQAKTIAALGMQGYSALLDGYPQVLLGSRASQRAKELKLSDALLGYMEISRCCIVRDQVYTVPALEIIKGTEAIRVLSRTPVTPGQAPQDNGSQPGTAKDNPGEPPPEPLTEPSGNPRSQGCASGLGGAVLVLSDDPVEPSDDNRKEQAFLALARGVSKSKIIKELWGFSGRKYESGKTLWEQLEMPD